MASQHEESSESDGETEPAKCFHRRLSTNKDIRYNTSIKEGFLSKQNGSFQRWHKRYFKLKSGVLYYSKHDKSTIFNQIDLIDSSIAERSLKNINHSFQVITPFRNLVLCAETRREMRDWVTAIRSASSKDFQEMTSEMAELSSLSDHHNWCVLPNIRPIFCNVCSESLQKVSRAGVTINGLACEVCKFRTHKKCASRSPPTCKWTTLASMGGNIMEDDEGNLSMPHQWLMGNFPVSSKCLICEKPCGSMLRLQDYWCLWCHCTVHTSCKEQTTWCSLGPARVSILPPTSITNFNEGGFWRASKSPSTSPLLVFLNSKSGDSQGVKMLRRFKQLLNPAQVFDLMNGGPKMGLRLFQNFESFRVLVCGGDGSVGWVLNEIDRLGLHKQCQVGVLPLGTGNDLSRVLGWGATFDDDTQLPSLLEKLEHAQIQMFDRWSIFSYETDQTRNTSLPIDPIGAYEDTAANHLSRILHSDSYNVVISSAMVLCSIVQELVSKVGSSIEDSEGCSSDRDSVAHKCLTLNEKMEALLKTLAEESNIGVSTADSEKVEDSTFERNIRSGSSPTPSSSPLPPPSSPILLEPPTVLSPQKRVHISPARALFLAPFSPSPQPTLSSPSSLTVTTGSLQQTESVAVVSSSSSSSSSRTSSTFLSPHHIPVFTTATIPAIQSSTFTSQPPYSSSSFQRASAISHHACLTDYQFRGLSPLLPSPQTLSPSVSPSPSSNLRQSPQPPSSHPPLPSPSFPAFESAKYLPPSSANEVCFDGGIPHVPGHAPGGPPITRKHLTTPGRGISFQRTTNKEVVRSREQLMCRANSLKKAIRQIVELTEKAVDEQNHQTSKFDHDNQKRVDETVDTVHTTSNTVPAASEIKTTEELVPTQTPFFDIPKVIIKTPSHGSMESGTVSVRGFSMDYTLNPTESEVQVDLPLSSFPDITSATTITTAIVTAVTSALLAATVAHHASSVSPLSFTAEPSAGTDAAAISCSDQPLTPRSPTSRAITPVTFNYQLCDLSAPSSSHPASQSSATFSVPPSKCPTSSMTVPWSTEYFRTSPAWLTHQRSPVRGSSGAAEGLNLTSDIPVVSIADDSILDDEVSEVMQDKMRHEASLYGGDHLAVPPPENAHHDPHNHIPHSSYLSPSHHYHFHQKRSSSPYHHPHAYHPYSSSNSDASCCSTPGRLTPQAFQQLSGLPSLVDRWSPLFGMSAGRTNSPLSSFFDKPSEARLPPADSKALPVDQSLHGTCSSHVGNGRHISSLSAMTRDKEVTVAQNGARHSLKGGESVQFPLLNIPLLQSLPRQVIGKHRKCSPIHSSMISRVLLANADALCAPASPLNDLENINLEDFTEKCVMNNYFGIGLDAKIALDFHNKREEHPQKCRSRTKNMMWYGVLGGKEILQRTYKNLDQRVRLECDGRLIPLPNLQGIVILNIPSYMGGTNFWGGSKEDEYFIAPSFDDKVLEVVAVFGSIQLGISRVINIQRHRIAQCRTVRITIIGDEGLPVQVDGEAWIQNPGVILIQHKNRAQVLIRDRAFEEALKNWAEKQKLDRTLTREPLLSESEVATLTSFVEASRDLFENVKAVTSTLPEVDISTLAQAVKFIENFKIRSASADGKPVAKTSRSDVMEFAGSMRSYFVDLKSTLNEREISEALRFADLVGPLRSSLEATEALVDKVHSIGAHFYESSSLQRGRNRDRLKSLFKLPKSSKRHKDIGKETSKPDVLSIRDWSNAEIALWLNSLDLPEYAESFIAHDIRGAELLTLGRTDLKELGVVKVGHLKRIIHEIKSIKESLKIHEGSKVVSEESSTSPLLQQQQPQP